MSHDAFKNGLEKLCQNDPRAEAVIAGRLPEIQERLAAYVERIELHNPAWGLVGTNDRQELVTRHIFDSLAPVGIIAAKINDSNNNNENALLRIADVGSGAGLPGIPLAIALPQIKFTLIERSGRRANFLRDTLAATGLENIIVEEAEMEKAKPLRFNAVTFRAFKTLDAKTLKKLFRLCCEGGFLAAYKGRQEKIKAEMETLEKAQPGLSGNWEFVPCPVPDLNEERHLVFMYPTNSSF